MAKSNEQTHKKRMDKNCHIPDLVQASSKCRKGWIKPCFKALNLSLSWQLNCCKIHVSTPDTVHLLGMFTSDTEPI